MRKIVLVIMTMFYLTLSFGQNKLQGTFVGLEKFPSSFKDPENPKYTWYHLCTLTIEGSKVYFDEASISIYKKDTLFSSSDGGFYSYRGILEYKNNAITADLKLKSCDYCGRQIARVVKVRIVPADSTGKDIADTIGTTKDSTIITTNDTMDKKLLFIKTTTDSNKITYKRDNRIIN